MNAIMVAIGGDKKWPLVVGFTTTIYGRKVDELYFSLASSSSSTRYTFMLVLVLLVLLVVLECGSSFFLLLLMKVQFFDCSHPVFYEGFPSNNIMPIFRMHLEKFSHWLESVSQEHQTLNLTNRREAFEAARYC